MYIHSPLSMSFCPTLELHSQLLCQQIQSLECVLGHSENPVGNKSAALKIKYKPDIPGHGQWNQNSLHPKTRIDIDLMMTKGTTPGTL